ncbi:MAG: hypothetical protein P8Y01_07855 [Woeseiaceae bacterium]|jgi:hypothetical protein
MALQTLLMSANQALTVCFCALASENTAIVVDFLYKAARKWQAATAEHWLNP